MGTPSYKGKQVYMGLHVDREFFVASCICDGVVVKRCRIRGTAAAVISLVSKECGGARVRAAYEAEYRKYSHSAHENTVIKSDNELKLCPFCHAFKA